MSKTKKIGTLLLSLILLIAIAAGCASEVPSDTGTTTPPPATSGNQETEPEEPAIDTSRRVDLVMYLMGSPPDDYDKVMEVVNQKLLQDINATLTIKYIGWTDWSTQYNLLLTSGEPIDIMYASNWTGFNNHVQAGAFLPLDDLLPIYAPESYTQLDDMDWMEATYEDKVYALPRNFVNVNTEGIVYRGDLADKYGITVDSMESFERYLQAVKDDPDESMLPFNMAGVDGENLLSIFFHAYGLAGNNDFSENMIVFDNKQENVRDLSLLAFHEDFEAYLYKMRDWYNAGYWSRNALSNNVLSREAFEQGQSAVTFGHLDRAHGVINTVLGSNPEWDPRYYAFVYDGGPIYSDAKMQDAMALPRSSQNPERALMMIELFRNDREYFDLTQYGIEGEHYILTEDGWLDLPEGITPDNNPFGATSLAGWGWWRTDYMRLEAGTLWPEVHEIRDDARAIAQNHVFTTFRVDQEPIRTEIAAIQQMEQQYFIPLLFGAVDVEEGIERYRTQLERAGIHKVFEEYTRQVHAFLDEIGR